MSFAWPIIITAVAAMSAAFAGPRFFNFGFGKPLDEPDPPLRQIVMPSILLFGGAFYWSHYVLVGFGGENLCILEPGFGAYLSDVLLLIGIFFYARHIIRAKLSGFGNLALIGPGFCLFIIVLMIIPHLGPAKPGLEFTINFLGAIGLLAATFIISYFVLPLLGIFFGGIAYLFVHWVSQYRSTQPKH